MGQPHKKQNNKTIKKQTYILTLHTPPSSWRLVPGPAGWCRRRCCSCFLSLVHHHRQPSCSCCRHLVRWCCSWLAELLNCIDCMTCCVVANFVRPHRQFSFFSTALVVIFTVLVVLRTLRTFFIALVVGHFRHSCCWLCLHCYLVVVLLSSVGWVLG